jgi:hypothetical protein
MEKLTRKREEKSSKDLYMAAKRGDILGIARAWAHGAVATWRKGKKLFTHALSSKHPTWAFERLLNVQCIASKSSKTDTPIPSLTGYLIQHL